MRVSEPKLNCNCKIKVTVSSVIQVWLRIQSNANPQCHAKRWVFFIWPHSGLLWSRSTREINYYQLILIVSSLAKAFEPFLPRYSDKTEKKHHPENFVCVLVRVKAILKDPTGFSQVLVLCRGNKQETVDGTDSKAHVDQLWIIKK